MNVPPNNGDPIKKIPVFPKQPVGEKNNVGVVFQRKSTSSQTEIVTRTIKDITASKNPKDETSKKISNFFTGNTDRTGEIKDKYLSDNLADILLIAIDELDGKLHLRLQKADKNILNEFKEKKQEFMVFNHAQKKIYAHEKHADVNFKDAIISHSENVNAQHAQMFHENFKNYTIIFLSDQEWSELNNSLINEFELAEKKVDVNDRPSTQLHSNSHLHQTKKGTPETSSDEITHDPDQSSEKALRTNSKRARKQIGTERAKKRRFHAEELEERRLQTIDEIEKQDERVARSSEDTKERDIEFLEKNVSPKKRKRG